MVKNRLLYIFIFLTLALLTSCEEEKTYTLGVDVQSFFDEDEVQIFLNKKLILKETLTTNNILGFSKGVKMAPSEGKHTLKVIVNENFVKSEEFNLHHNLYVGIMFNPNTEEISFIHSDHPFGYD